MGSCQLCGQLAGKLLTEGVRGREGGRMLEEVMSHPTKSHSDPHSNLQGHLTALLHSVSQVSD